MFEALVITLREGVEAAMVLAIALAILKRRGLERLNGALYAGAAIAIAVSVAIAAALTRLDYNQEIAEGAAKLIGAVLVLTLVAWMWKARAAHEVRDRERDRARRARACQDHVRASRCSPSAWCSAKASRPRSSSRPPSSTARGSGSCWGPRSGSRWRSRSV